MHSYQEIRADFDKFFENNLPFPKKPSGLYDPCYYILEDSGKRIRPSLCIISNQLFGGDLADDVYNVAMALELFHNFTLIHDDIMDEAPLRRGKPTVHQQFGTSSGILSGDVMNIFSYKCLSTVRPHLLKPILDLFNTTAIEVCEGQQLDMDFEQSNNVSIEDYLYMIKLKTSVLLACGLKSGAILAEASQEECELIYDLGINLGMAFQIQDDYLDTFGNADNFGKKVGGDIRSNKKTYLYLKALELASEEQLVQMHQLQKRNDEEKVEETIELFKSLKIDTETENLIHQYFAKVMHNLNALPTSESVKKPLLQLIQGIVIRQK